MNPNTSLVRATMTTATLAAALLACGPAGPVCAPNATQSCVCPDGRSGSQTCTADGEGFSHCACTGTGNDVGVQSDGSTPPPPPACNTASSCASCTPMDGCGWCNGRCVAGTSGGSNDGACSGASWAWLPSQCSAPPPMCTRSAENTAAACSDGCDNDGNGASDCDDVACCNVATCGPTTACGRRAMCAPCGSDGACAGGAMCLVRVCDGRPGCYADAHASCTTIGGVACPAVSVYDRCTTSADCGPLATCFASFWGGPPRCWPMASSSGVCPGPPPTATGVTASNDSTVCEMGTNGGASGCNYQCALHCAAGATCPYGMTCTGGRCVN